MNNNTMQLDATNSTCEEWLEELEHTIYEYLDKQFVPSKKAMEELSSGKDDESSIYHQELSSFTLNVAKVIYDRINKKYTH